ncbi:MAG: hypothetical protein ACRD2U_03315 [Terriglobales bacterium]
MNLTQLTTTNTDLRWMWLTQDDAHCISGNQEFFVGWDGIGEQLAFVCADLAFATDRFLIFAGSRRRPADSIPAQIRV